MSLQISTKASSSTRNLIFWGLGQSTTHLHDDRCIFWQTKRLDDALVEVADRGCEANFTETVET
jgi:hypothetical protein